MSHPRRFPLQLPKRLCLLAILGVAACQPSEPSADKSDVRLQQAMKKVAADQAKSDASLIKIRNDKEFARCEALVSGRARTPQVLPATAR